MKQCQLLPPQNNYSEKLIGEYVLINLERISRVGIRTWSPANTLDSTGDVRATGNVCYGGNVVSSDGTLYSNPDSVFKDNPVSTFNILDDNI